MTMVVTAPCRGCKDMACTKVCPVECFHDAGDMLVIDPTECIDCYACIPECPVDAIFHEDDVPEKWASFIETNAELSQTAPLAEHSGAS